MRIPLPRLPARLFAEFGEGAPGYRKIYMLALDGRVPTTEVKGRLFVEEADLPKIAEIFGLKSRRTSREAA